MVGGGPFLLHILPAQSLPSETSLLTLFLSPRPLLYLSPYHWTVACLITHADTNVRVENCRCRYRTSFLLLLSSLSVHPSHFFINPPFRQEGDMTLSAPFWQRHISPYQSSICRLYMYVFALRVCVCAGWGLASGRLPVNTDLCDGSISDFIISDKARVEQEVNEGLWGLGKEVMLGAGSLQPYIQANKTQTGSISPMMWADM